VIERSAESSNCGSPVKLQYLLVSGGPLHAHVRLFLPDGTEIPNVAQIVLSGGGWDGSDIQPQRVTLELYDVEWVKLDEAPRKESPCLPT
jgi:hypothetical protein